MKYRQLTKEQFEALDKEFAKFLATQQIDANEWRTIKSENPKMADEELNLFSDMVWEDVLGKINYLEHFSEKNMNLFKCDAEKINRIVVEISKDNFSFFNKTDFQWFVNNTNDKTIQLFKGSKKYTEERNTELFDLIQKGSVISNGELYENIFKLISR